MHTDSRGSIVAQVCFSGVPRPPNANKPPKTVAPTAQNCGSYVLMLEQNTLDKVLILMLDRKFSLDARIKILAGMYCSHQYISIKKKLATPT